MKKNLLILGAGQYSCVVRETAEAMGCFDRIEMLDDNRDDVLGKIDEFENFREEFPCAAVAIGTNEIRLELIEKVQKDGFELPVLVHPRAYVSPSAQIGPGSIVEPFAVIQANVSVGKGCIISSTAVVNHNAVIEDGAHCDCGTVISARALVPGEYKVKNGAVYYAMEKDEGDVRYPSNYSAEDGI